MVQEELLWLFIQEMVEGGVDAEGLEGWGERGVRCAVVLHQICTEGAALSNSNVY